MVLIYVRYNGPWCRCYATLSLCLVLVVTLNVFREVIRSHEATIASGANEFFLAGVRSLVS